MGLSPEEISSLESELGVRFPKDIRDVYSAQNELLGPTDIAFLWPAKNSDENIIANNTFYADDENFRLRPKGVTFFGDEGTGGVLFFDNDTHRAGIWHPADGAETHTHSLSVSDLWSTIQQSFDAALEELENE